MDTQLVVIGGGPGGYSAAFLAADLGMRVTLVDMEPRLGGVCLLRGCIPSKALLHVAKAVNEASDLSEWGVDFGKPTFTVDAIRARKDKVVDTLTGGLKQLASRREVQVIRARATFIDPKTLQLAPVGDEPLDDDRIHFDHCIVATGSSPVTIDSLNLPTGRAMDSTGALALPDIPGRLLVVGGGYIGLEMATIYAALGSRVSVVELTDGLLPGADRDLVRPLQRRLEKQFEAIRLKTKVAQIVDCKKKIEVTLSDDSGESTERFDRVLACVGRKPNSADLGLESTLVKLDDRGFIEVDKEQRTADRNILAIGDVAGEPMLAHKAAH